MANVTQKRPPAKRSAYEEKPDGTTPPSGKRALKNGKYIPLIVLSLLFFAWLSACSPDEPPVGDVDIRGYDGNEEDDDANEEDVDPERNDLLPRTEERGDANPWRDRDLDDRLIDDDLEDLDRRDVSGRNDPGNNDDDSDIFDSDRGGGLRE